MQTPPTTPDDDREGDIANDSFLSSLDADLKRARKKFDTVFMIVLGVAAAVVIAIERLPNTPKWTSAALIIAMLLLVAGCIAAYSGARRRVADRYGLACPSCGHRPQAHRVMEAAMVGRCSRCKTSLPLGDSRLRTE